MGVRDRIAAELTAAPHGGDLKLERYAAPPGDPGLFGITPADPVRRVHGQATGMLTGGFAALMLQSLHPLAMAGVGQYSDFRADPVGRLNKTVRFITTTTFGSSPAAREVIGLVRRIHTRVHGTAPDGRPYRADDPDLLTWVHTAEVRSFLAGHQAYAPRPRRLTPAECDTYYRQAAPVAEELGARKVPRTASGTRHPPPGPRPRLLGPAPGNGPRTHPGMGARPLPDPGGGTGTAGGGAAGMTRPHAPCRAEPGGRRVSGVRRRDPSRVGPRRWRPRPGRRSPCPSARRTSPCPS